MLCRMYFTGNNGYQIFLVFAPILSSLILNYNKKVTNWTSNVVWSEKILPFDPNLEPIISNLVNGRVILTFNNSALVPKGFYSLFSNFVLNLYIAYELNNWRHNTTNNFTL